MSTPVFNKKEIAEYCRILGIHVTDSLKEIKQARNRLAKLYHPDKHHDLESIQLAYFQDKFQKIQHAYDYINDHYDEIQNLFIHLKDYTLTSKGNQLNRSHWLYKSVSKMNNSSNDLSDN